ncbi:MAG: aldo/keto reductase [Gemmatimonadetes bacterium]|nr:aldo/keto reductase [Gemmatimonadota bacterium]
MEHRAFGRTGMEVPAVGMGTWQTFDVSGEPEEAERRAIVDAAIAAGTTLFDTSPMYGESERVLGNALEGRRDGVLVADKVWTRSASEGRAQIERALGWYGGSVDIYQIHNLVAWRTHLPILEELRAAGKVGIIGATHYQHSAFGELMELMSSGRIQMIQVPYNAADRLVERQVLPLADELGIGVLVMRPLGAGELVRRPPSAAQLQPLARFRVHTWAQALLKWVLSDPRAHCVIPATSKPARAEENAAAGGAPWFDADTREYVSRLAGKIMNDEL